MKNFLKSNRIIISFILALTLGFIIIIFFQFHLSDTLTDLNSKFNQLEKRMKDHETTLKNANRIQENEKIQEIKKIKDLQKKLNLIEKKVQLTADILTIADKLQLDIQITSDPNEWSMDSDILTATYEIHNLSALPCFMEMRELIITRENDAKGNQPFVEGVDFIFQKREFPIFRLKANEKIPYKETILFNRKRLSQIFNDAPGKIVIKALFHAKTNHPLLSSLPDFLRKIIGEEKLSKLFELDITKEYSLFTSFLRPE